MKRLALLRQLRFKISGVHPDRGASELLRPLLEHAKSLLQGKRDPAAQNRLKTQILLKCEQLRSDGYSIGPEAYHVVIMCMLCCGQLDHAVRLYDEMTAAGVEPKPITCSNLLPNAARQRRFDVCLRLVDRLKQVNTDEVSTRKAFAGTLRMYGEMGSENEALAFFMSTHPMRPDRAMLNSLLSACRSKEAVNIVLQAMNNESIDPCAITIGIFLKLLGADRRAAEELFASLPSRGIVTSERLYHHLLEVYRKAGDAMGMTHVMARCINDNRTLSMYVCTSFMRGVEEIFEAETDGKQRQCLIRVAERGFQLSIVHQVTCSRGAEPLFRMYGKLGWIQEAQSLWKTLIDLNIYPGKYVKESYSALGPRAVADIELHDAMRNAGTATYSRFQNLASHPFRPSTRVG
ncbi:Pentatricopeptide repeat-containing protein [Diplonema papillatum]|nr:Pentatricopeptide repeat-containing protein [Diplonema papillatum]